jgi:hypothetical protein
MAPLIVMLIVIAVPLWVGWSSMSYEPSGGAAKARNRAAHLTFSGSIRRDLGMGAAMAAFDESCRHR